MPSPEHDLASFLDYSVKHLESDSPKLSPEELLRTWRRRQDSDEAIADIRQGFIDLAAGRTTPVEDVLLRIRRKLGLAS